MKEDFLHYLWKYKKFDIFNLKTSEGETVEVLKTGQHNDLAGPDFFNAQLVIGDQHWAGNVELHICASHWYAHGHENDAHYDNTILHVVWENDMDVYGKNNRPLPTMILKDFIAPSLITSYKKLFDHQQRDFNNCGQEFGSVPMLVVQDWLECLYLERLERKVKQIEVLLGQSNNDWEAVLFKMLARSFGTKINGAAFESMAENIPFKTLRKIANKTCGLEAVFLGCTQLLPEDHPDAQVAHWQRDYDFLKAKYDLETADAVPMQFFRLRPANFPTIRLSQLSAIYEREHQLFSKIVQMNTLEDYYALFSVKASGYWDTHFNFGKSQPKRKKELTKSFIDLLLINTIIPIKFAHNRAVNNMDQEPILNLISQIAAEKNKITDQFYQWAEIPKNALMSQGLLQLKNEYCDKNQCLKCRVGNHLINSWAD